MSKEKLIKTPEEIRQDCLKDVAKQALPKNVRFHDLFEAYISTKLQDYITKSITKEMIDEIYDLMYEKLNSLFQKSSSNYKVSAEGIKLIVCTYMNNLSINNVENFLISVEKPESVAKSLSIEELRFLKDLFKDTMIEDYCEYELSSRQ